MSNQSTDNKSVKIELLVLLFLFLSIAVMLPCPAVAEIKWLNPTPFGSNYYDIYQDGNNYTLSGMGGMLLHYEDGNYRIEKIPGSADYLKGIIKFPNGEIFVVGHGYNTANSLHQTAIIYHYNGSSWSKMSHFGDSLRNTNDDYEEFYLYSIWGNSPTNIYAIGYYREENSSSGNPYPSIVRSLILHYNGITWEKIDVPNFSPDWAKFNDVSGYENNIYIVGSKPSSVAYIDRPNGVFLKFNGSEWTNETLSYDSQNTICVVNNENVYFGGIYLDTRNLSHPTIHKYDGSSIVEYNPDFSAGSSVLKIWHSNNELYAISSSGTTGGNEISKLDNNLWEFMAEVPVNDYGVYYARSSDSNLGSIVFGDVANGIKAGLWTASGRFNFIKYENNNWVPFNSYRTYQSDSSPTVFDLKSQDNITFYPPYFKTVDGTTHQVLYNYQNGVLNENLYPQVTSYAAPCTSFFRQILLDENNTYLATGQYIDVIENEKLDCETCYPYYNIGRLVKNTNNELFAGDFNGDYGATSLILKRISSKNWQVAFDDTRYLSGIQDLISFNSNIYGVGVTRDGYYTRIIQYDGAGWNYVNTGINITTNLYSIWGLNENSLYVVGKKVPSSSSLDSVLFHKGDGTWSQMQVSAPIALGYIYYVDIFGFSEHELFILAADGYGQSAIYYYNGTNWSLFTIMPFGMYQISGDPITKKLFVSGYGANIFSFDLSDVTGETDSCSQLKLASATATKKSYPTKINLNWALENPNNCTCYYSVCRSADPSEICNQTYELTYSDTNLKPNSIYNYAIEYHCDCGEETCASVTGGYPIEGQTSPTSLGPFLNILLYSN
jgi:hypothetical protein